MVLCPFGGGGVGVCVLQDDLVLTTELIVNWTHKEFLAFSSTVLRHFTSKDSYFISLAKLLSSSD